MEIGQELVEEGHPQAEEFQGLIDGLRQRWQDLKDALDARNASLEVSNTAQQVMYRY